MDPVTNIKRGLKKDFASGRHSDLTLVVGLREFHVHKLVLSWQSPVFEAMLSSRWDKSTKSTDQKLSIPLPDDDPEVMETILNYIYNNIVEDKFCPTTVSLMIFWVHVYATADKYGLDHLKGVVLSKFKRSLDPKDVSNFVAAVAEVNENTADRTLWAVVIPKIRENISFLVNQAEFQQLMFKMPQLNFELLAMLDPNHTAGSAVTPSVKMNMPYGNAQGGAQHGNSYAADQGDGDDDGDDDDMDDGGMHDGTAGGSGSRWHGSGGLTYGAGRRLGD